MKRPATFVLLFWLMAICTASAHARQHNRYEPTRASRKYAKEQQKAMKKAAKAQRKELKRTQKRTYRQPGHFPG